MNKPSAMDSRKKIPEAGGRIFGTTSPLLADIRKQRELDVHCTTVRNMTAKDRKIGGNYRGPSNI